jgi:hypothetical protein
MINHVFRVGDVAYVGRAVFANRPGSLALVIELYDRSGFGGAGVGVTLLFPNGFLDGFSPDDLMRWDVRFDHHVAALERYHFENVGRVEADLRAGRFAAAWG